MLACVLVDAVRFNRLTPGVRGLRSEAILPCGGLAQPSVGSPGLPQSSGKVTSEAEDEVSDVRDAGRQLARCGPALEQFGVAVGAVLERDA
jgi:hypothetical protein